MDVYINFIVMQVNKNKKFQWVFNISEKHKLFCKTMKGSPLNSKNSFKLDAISQSELYIPKTKKDIKIQNIHGVVKFVFQISSIGWGHKNYKNNSMLVVPINVS